MKYFDYERVAAEAELKPEELKLLCDVIQRDYPHDQMLFELHVLRACTAIRDGQITLEEAFEAEMSSKAHSN